MTTPTLFDPEDLIEWVVEVDEILLNSIGAQDRSATPAGHGRSTTPSPAAPKEES